MAARRRPESLASVPHPDSLESGPRGVPSHVLDQARAAFDRPASGELVTLVFDSLVDEGAPSGDHWLRFEHPGVQIDVQVSATPEGTRLAGATRPARAHKVELQFEGGEGSLVEESREGTFHFGHVPHGVVRLRLTGSRGTAGFRTDWFRV